MQVTHPVVSDRSQLFDSAKFQSLVKQIALFKREGVQEDKKTLYGLQAETRLSMDTVVQLRAEAV